MWIYVISSQPNDATYDWTIWGYACKTLEEAKTAVFKYADLNLESFENENTLEWEKGENKAEQTEWVAYADEERFLITQIRIR